MQHVCRVCVPSFHPHYCWYYACHMTIIPHIAWIPHAYLKLVWALVHVKTKGKFGTVCVSIDVFFIPYRSTNYGSTFTNINGQVGSATLFQYFYWSGDTVGLFSGCLHAHREWIYSLGFRWLCVDVGCSCGVYCSKSAHTLAGSKLHCLVSAWYYTVGGLPTIACGCVAPHSVSLSLVPPSLFLPSFSLSSPFLFPPLSFPLNTVDICPFYWVQTILLQRPRSNIYYSRSRPSDPRYYNCCLPSY